MSIKDILFRCFKSTPIYGVLSLFALCLPINVICKETSYTVKLSDGLQISSVEYQSGLQVIIASNPEFKKDSICLFVKAGHFNDPQNKSGIAHLVEHTFHHVTQKNGFIKKLSENNGYYSASTQGTNTKYYFSFKKEKTSWILENIALFLSGSNFNSSYLLQELKVIEEEQRERLSNPNYEVVNKLQTLSHSNHPFSKHIQKGHELTSYNPKELQNEVESFFNSHYQPNNIIVFISTSSSFKESLAYIEKSLHKQILAKAKPSPSNPRVSAAFPSGDLIKIIKLNKSEDNERLAYIFPLTLDYSMNEYFTFEVLKFLFSLKGNGSFYEYLISNGLSNSIEVDSYPIDTNQELFSVEFSLTKKGLSKINEIESNLFNYLHAIYINHKSSSNSEFIQSLITHRLSQETDSFALLEKLILPLDYNPNISKTYLSWYQKKPTIDTQQQRVLSSILNSEPIRILNFDLDKVNPKQGGTNFTTWKTHSNPNALPKSNKRVFIINELDYFTSFLSSSRITNSEHNTAPKLVYQSPSLLVWHRHIHPTSTYSGISIKFGIKTDAQEGKETILETILIKKCELNLNTLKDKLLVAGGDILIQNLNNTEISLSIVYPTSFHDHVIEEIKQVFTKYDLTENEFDNLLSIIRSEVKSEATNINYHEPRKIIQLVLNNKYRNHLNLETYNLLTYNDYILAENKFKQSPITVFINGSLTEPQALKTANEIQKTFRSGILYSEKNVTRSNTENQEANLFHPGVQWRKFDLKNQKGKYLIASFFLKDCSHKNLAMMYMLRSYFENMIFDYFRSQENPTYTAEIHTYDQSMQFVLYSSEMDEIKLSAELDKFLIYARKKLWYHNFLKIKKSYIHNTWFERQPFKEKNMEYWRDLISKDYGVDYRNKVKLSAETVSYHDFDQFITTFLLDITQKIQLNIYNDYSEVGKVSA